MLASITITDFAIIERLQLDFAGGFVVLTGETGAGKSIIIDAVGLLLGGKADASLVRAGADLARVEGVFRPAGAAQAATAALLRRESLLGEAEAEADELILTRDLRREGRSTCRVNGQLISLAILRELGQCLVDVHGQSEHLSLLRVREHVFLLDRFADLDEKREAFGRAARELGGLRHELTQLRRDESERERRLDMLNFQINEITSARLKPGEEQALLQERNRLANTEKLAALAGEAVAALAGSDEEPASAADLLSQAAKALGQLARIDPTLDGRRAEAQALAEQFKDLAAALQDYREAIEFNPKRLNAVEERLELIGRLKRKYGESLDGVLAFAAKAQADRAALANASSRIAELERTEKDLLQRAGQLAAELSTARRAAGERLARGIEAELNDLRMERARFAVDVQWQDDPDGLPADGRRLAFDGTGVDRVEFLVAPNIGEGLKPLVKVASGGETARLMLALKGVLARADQTPTLIFDEIDQGIGGRVGTVVGRKLWDLARAHQVLCITHLPQLAGYGDQHVKVEKAIARDRTLAVARLLSAPERAAELAQMLGGAGEKIGETAQELLDIIDAEKKAAGPGRAAAA